MLWGQDGTRLGDCLCPGNQRPAQLPAEQLINSSHGSGTVSSLSGKKKQPGSCSLSLLTMGENCLVLSVSQEPHENVESRRKGTWGMEWMDEWINSPRKQLEKIRIPRLETLSGNVCGARGIGNSKIENEDSPLRKSLVQKRGALKKPKWLYGELSLTQKLKGRG